MTLEQIMLGIFIVYFVSLIFMFLNCFWVSYIFKKEMHKTNPDDNDVFKLWHDVYKESKDPLDQMGVFGKQIRLSREMDKVFPTGNIDLDEKYFRSKKKWRRMAIYFLGLIVYMIIFMITMLSVYGDK